MTSRPAPVGRSRLRGWLTRAGLFAAVLSLSLQARYPVSSLAFGGDGERPREDREASRPPREPLPDLRALAPHELLARGQREPAGVAVAPDGRVYFTDERAGALYEATGPVAPPRLLAGGLLRPRGVIWVEPNELLLVAEGMGSGEDDHASRRRGLILRFDLKTGVLTVLADGLRTPRGLARASDGSLYVSAEGLRGPGDRGQEDGDFDERREERENDEDDARRASSRGTIFRWTRAAGLRAVVEGFKRPDGLVVRADGSLLVAAERLRDGRQRLEGSVFTVATTGTVGVYVADRLEEPAGLAVDAAGAIFVSAEEREGRHADGEFGGLILKRLRDGRIVEFARGLDEPRGLALGRDGHLVAADGDAGVVIRFRAAAPPVLQVADNTATNKDPFGLKGTASPGARIIVLGGREEAAAAAPQGTFEVPVPLRHNQPNALVVVAVGAGDGLSSPPVAVTIIHDDVPPRITVAAEPPPNPAGWNRTDVSVRFACADELSGVAACPSPVRLATEGARQPVVGTAIDRAGNTATATAAVSIDKTPPSVTAAPSPRANAAGWNSSDVTVTYACNDTLSGVAQCSPPQVITTEGADQTVAGAATDVAGNTAGARARVSIDKTPPTIAAVASPAANASGWHNADVTVRFQCSDGGSGLADCAAAQSVTAEGASQTVTGDATDRAGNRATASATISLDKTPPTIAAGVAPPPNARGWHDTPPTVSFTCNDLLSGVEACPDPRSVTTEGQNQPIEGTARDRAGNTARASAAVSLDRTPPTVAAAISPAPNAAGWNHTDVTVSFQCADTGSAVAECGAPQVVTTEGAGQAVSGRATDAAGNTAITSVILNVDKTPPTIAATRAPDPNVNGWNNSPVTVRFTCGDTGSGVAQCAGPEVVSTEGARTVTGTVTDVAGNAAGASVEVSVDLEPPVIRAVLSAPANAHGWHDAPVTVRFECGDAGSGIADCSPPQEIAAEGRDQTASGRATDKAGHSATASATVQLDRTPPHVAITTPAEGTRSRTATIAVSGTADDALSGLARLTCNGVPAAAAGSGFACNVTLVRGPNTIAVEATDLAGHVSSARVGVTFDANEPPTARPGGPYHSEAGSPISFDGSESSDPEGQPLTFQWDFGDGTAGSGAKPVHAYAAAGQFPVRLTVTDTDGASHTADTTALITPANRKPTANAGGPYAGEVGSAITFDGSGSEDPDHDALTFAWEFGDGATGNGSSPGHAYGRSGDFTVRLTVSDGRGGTDTATAQAAVRPRNRPPTASLGGPYSSETGQVIAFDGTASKDPDNDRLTFAWTFGDGTTESGPAPTHAFAAPGQYTVTLTVSDGRGGADAGSVIAVVSPPNRPPAARAGGPYTGAAGSPIAFSGVGSSDPDGDVLSFAWDYGDGASGAGVTPTHAYAASGTFTVTLTASDGKGGVAQATTSAVVSAAADRAAPAVKLIAPKSALPGTRVTVVADAADNVAVTSVTFEVAGAADAPLAAPPYERAIDVPALAAPGSTITVKATARDAATNAGADQAVITIVATPDTTPPTVSLSAPSEAAPGATIRLVARAADDVGVTTVEFLAGNTPLATHKAPPFETTFAIPATTAVGSSLGFTARAVDDAGNQATATASVPIVAAADTTPPHVTLSAPAEALPGSGIALSATATDNVGVASVTFFVDGVRVGTTSSVPYRVELTLPALVPGTIVSAEARAADYSGLEASDTAQVRITAVGRGLVAGEVYDDTSGLPLEGATVLLSGGGTSGIEAARTATSDAHGRYAFEADTGEARIRIAKPGWTVVERVVTAVAGRATEPLDARLTPRAAAGTPIPALIGATRPVPGYAELWRRELGTAPAVDVSSTAEVSVPGGALASDTALVATPIGRQGLQGLLPRGWSPVAALDIAPHGVALASPATLHLPNPVPVAGRTLVLAVWDEQEKAWRAAASAPSDGSVLAADVSASGQFAWLLPDVTPAAPPLPASGELLAAVDGAAIPADVTTVIDPRPKIAFYKPGVHSTVRGTVTSAAPLPSGTVVTATIREAYAFTTGAQSQPEPSVQDLVLYQTSPDGSTLAAAHVVSPSLTFDPATFQRGVIEVQLQAPLAQPRPLVVVGPDGGVFAAPTGETLTVPPGAVGGSLALSLEKLSAADLGLTLPGGLELVGAVSLEVAGGSFGAPGLLSVARPAAIVDAARLLVARIDIVGGATRLVVVAGARFSGDRIVSETAVPGSPIAFEGIRTAGRYVVVRSLSPLGFVTGTVFAAAGPTQKGALVSTDTLPVAALSGPAGTFLAAAAVGHLRVTAVDPRRTDAASAEAELPAAGSVVSLDLHLVASRPQVLAISPLDGAVNVSPATPIVVTFSEPIDPASVSAANTGRITLAAAGAAAVAGSVSLSSTNTVLTFRPIDPLAPNTAYTVTVAESIADLSGTTLGAPFVFHFTSLDTEPPPTPAAGTLSATIPGLDGITTVRGTQGTASAHDTVSIVNVTAGTFTPVLLDPNGGFSVGVPASLFDVLQLKIVDAAGNETVAALPGFAQTNGDGSTSAVVGPDGGRIVGPAGIVVDVPSSAFQDGTIVTIKAVEAADFPVSLTAAQRELFTFTRGVSLDFGGATPSTELDVSFSAAGGETPQDRWVLGAVQTVDGQPLLDVVDTARLIDGRITTSSPPCPGVRQAGTYGLLFPRRILSMAFGDFAMEADSLGAAAASIVQRATELPYQLLATPAVRQRCAPILSGRVTVTPNNLKVLITPDQLTPADREIVVRDQKTRAEFHHPRNVVEYRFQVAGGPTDHYQVAVVSGGGSETVVPAKVSAGPAGTAVVRVDMDRVNVSVTSVLIRNLSRNPVSTTSFPQSAAVARIQVSGGAGDGFEVRAVDADGRDRVIAFSIESPPGGGNLVARAVPDTIGPNVGVFLIDENTQARLQIPAGAFQAGGFFHPFDGTIGHQYRVEVQYSDRVPDFLDVPAARIIVTNRATGRVIRTLDVPVPPADDPFPLGVIAGDVQPPFLVATPPLLNNFDPFSALTFSFSEGIDRDSARIGLSLLDATGQPVAGDVRLSNGNRSVTFVPATTLKMGAKYTVRLDGLRDAAGNRLAATTVALKTSEPRRIGPTFVPEQVGFVKDFALLGSATGSTSHLFAVSTNPNTVIGFDVTDPLKPLRVENGFLSDADPARAAVLRRVKDVPLRRPNPCTGATTFSGDLAFVVRTFRKSTDAIDTHTNSMLMFDLTNPAKPCQLGVKVLGQGGLNEPDRSPGVIQRAGTAQGVAALSFSHGAQAYAAVANMGLLAADVGANAGDFSYSEQRVEAMVPGDYVDVVAVGNRLAAIERTNGTLDFFDAGLSPLQSLPLSLGAPTRLAFAEAMPIDTDGDGTIGSDEALDLLFVAGAGGIAVVNVTDPANPSLMDVIAVNATLFELEIDREKARLFAGGFRPEGGDWAVFLIDLSGADALPPSGFSISTPPSDLPPPGICETGQHRTLQDDVDLKCHSTVRACKGDQDLPTLEANRDKRIACLKARVLINRTCFPPEGNLKHQKAVLDEREGLQNCFEFIQKKKRERARGLDQQDDRVIWQSAPGLYAFASSGYRGLRFDSARGILYVGTQTATGGGIDAWTFTNQCCDLAVDLAARPRETNTGGDRGDLLAREKKALQTGITAGLDVAGAACGVPFRSTGAPATSDSASIFEQGSGSCIWKPNPLEDCGTAYQPGLSDHDYEVYMPEKYFHLPAPSGKGGEVAAICVVRLLGDQFTNADGTPKEIDVGGAKVSFDDITFFPFVREHFENARLNVNPPKNPGGDPTGDLAMGRQQLLLLWLLGGEYIQVTNYSVDGKPLDDILEDLKNSTGIPRLEGYEWANLQRFNLLKTKAFLRVKGAADASSAFHGLFVKQVHDAAKSAIRATFAQMVADEDASKLILNVRRTSSSGGTGPAYDSNACLSIKSADPSTWTGKRCQAFEEYVASVAARTITDGNLSLFTPDQIFNQIHRFWRIKGDVESIDDDAAGDAFIADVSNFIGGIAGDVDPAGGVLAKTRQIYEETVDTPDPGTPRCEAPDRDASKCRRDNLNAVQQKIKKAAKGVTLHVVPRVSNQGFTPPAQVQVEMYRGDGAGAGTPIADRGNPATPPIRVSLAGNERRFLDSGSALLTPEESDDPTPEERNLDDLPRLETDLHAPMFELGNKKACGATPPAPGCALNPTLDLKAAPPRWAAFTIDLPERKKKEANRLNNYDGFFYYILDRANPTPPPTPPQVPFPLADPGLLKPDAECQEAPALEVTQSITVAGQTFTDVATLNVNETAELRFVVKNTSARPVSNVQVCSSITPPCEIVGNIAPGESTPKVVPYTAPGETGIIDPVTVTASSPETGVSTGNPLRLIIACEPYSVVPLDPDPNPDPPGAPNASPVEEGGKAIRYYRVIDRRTGQPLTSAPVKAELQVPGGPAQTLEFLTDAEGIIASPDARGMSVPYPAKVPPGTEVSVRVTEVNGVAGACLANTAFGLSLKEREFSGTFTAGASLEAEGNLNGVDLLAGAGVGLSGRLNSTTTGDKELLFGRLLSHTEQAGLKGKFEKSVKKDWSIIRLPFTATATKGEGEVGVRSVGMTTDLHRFPLPLSAGDLVSLSALSLSAAYAAPLGATPAGPVLFRVLDELFERATGLDATRTRLGLSSMLGVEANGEVKGVKVMAETPRILNPLINTSLGVNADVVKGSGKAAIVLSVDVLPRDAPPRLAAGVEYRGEVKWSVNADFALKTILGKPQKDSLLSQEEILKKLAESLNDVRKLLTDGDLGGNVKFTVFVDAEAVKLKAVTVSISQRKKYGFTYQGDKLVDQGDGNMRTMTFRVTDRDPAKLQKAVEQVLLVQAHLAGTALSAAHGPAPIGANFLAQEMATLIGYADDYETTFQSGKGLPEPFGLSDLLKGTPYDKTANLGLKIDFDSTTRYVIERGVVRRGGMYPLERYPDPDPTIPVTQADKLLETIRQAKEIAENITERLRRLKERIGKILAVFDFHFSPSGVRLEIDGAAEPDTGEPFDVSLFAFQYTPVPPSLAPTIPSPADVGGTADRPHYGIGGFFQFTPEGRVLAAPATLTIYYLDPEVAAFDESSLAIYRWNYQKGDWDRVGGVVDAAANTVTATVDVLGLYTIGVPMASGSIQFSSRIDGAIDPQLPTTAVFTSGTIRMNTGDVVPNGTKFTVYTLAPDTVTLAPLGTILTPDADPLTDGVQVVSQDGAFQFTATFPPGVKVPLVVGFATRGTAFGGQVIRLQ